MHAMERKRRQNKTEKDERTAKVTAKETDSSINPWSLSSTAAPSRSLAPARPAPTAAADATDADVTITAAGPPPSSANITLEPSIDLQR